MPYIPVLWRPIFDAIFAKANRHCYEPYNEIASIETGRKVVEAMQLFPLEKQCGCLNYFITRCIISGTNLELMRACIERAFYYACLEKPSYFNYCIGLSTVVNVFDEFKRRESLWSKMPEVYVDCLEKLFVKVVQGRNEYELKKQKEVGDI